MTKRIHRRLLALFAIAAMAFGGAAVTNAAAQPGPEPASNETGPEPATSEQESTAPENSASDPDNVQLEQQGENQGDNGSGSDNGSQARSSKRAKARSHRARHRHHRSHQSSKKARAHRAGANSQH